ncbi:hypothetical protein L386_02265 [Klebsiella variicola]|nr:hypothetical protein L386_02265 [Klebsiella variicola]
MKNSITRMLVLVLLFFSSMIYACGDNLTPLFRDHLKITLLLMDLFVFNMRLIKGIYILSKLY